jgi:penicillin-binding protein 1A
MDALLAHKVLCRAGLDRKWSARRASYGGRQRRRTMIKFIRFLFVCGVILAVAGCGLVGITIWYFGRDLPDYQQLAHYQPPITTRVHAGDGRLLAEYATERRIFVPIQAIPKQVVNAFLSAEDKNFYSHHGIDPVSIVRAALTDLGRFRANRRPVGASTITQQVAKNMLLSNEISIERKVKEVLLATRIEAVLPKDRILELYLNEIYLGAGAYGVAAAALTYFDKSLEELTLGEAAFLAGLPKAPNRYNPARVPQAAQVRRDWVLDRMVEDGAVSQADAAQAEGQPLELRHRQDAEEVSAPYFAEEVRRELITRYGEKVLYGAGLSVRTSLDERLQAASDKALRDGLIAYEHKHGGWRGPVTRIDPKGDWLAHLAAAPIPGVVRDVGWHLAMVTRSDADGAAIGFANGATGRIPFSEMRWARPWHSNGNFGPYPRSAADVVKPGDVVMVASAKGQAEGAKPAVFTLCQVPEISGALVVMDPHTGRVLAISGGFSFETSQFNRATQAKRQTGSTIKPFIFLAALDNGFTPSTLIDDSPISLPQGPGLPMWTPRNYTKEGQEVKYRGPTPLRIAIEKSIDTMTVRAAKMIGLEPIGDTIEGFGIMDHMPREYSMVLGAGETTPLRMTAAYGMLVNGGKRITPTFIDRIQDRNGATMFSADQRPCPGCDEVDWERQPVPVVPDTREQVADPGSAYQIVTMLEGVVQRGTGTAVKVVGKPIAGKTGTTNDWRDAWFVGFTPDLVAGVYVGFDDPDSLGDDETGGHVAAPIFRDFMIEALKDAPATDFRIPPGMRVYRVSAATGLPVGAGEQAIYEAYKPGTEPGQSRKVEHLREPEEEEEEMPVASTGEEAGVKTPPLSLPPRGAPASGTGGLY